MPAIVRSPAHRVLLRSALATIALLPACSAGMGGGARGHAEATLHDAAGAAVGTVTFSGPADGPITLAVKVTGLPAGTHGIHLHAVGRCDAQGATPFASAGGHFNPAGKQHGLENPAGPHAGDLPNVVVGADGTGSATFTTDRITLGGGASSVFDADGTAVVLHAGADDQHTDPAGNSGGRIACGVVTPA